QPDFSVMISAELFTCISDYNDKLLIYISKNDLKKKFIMQWDKKDKPVQTTAENVIFNLVTHNAYHRGQIAIFLRILGFDSIKETDFNPYLYELGQK
ncbi:MAG: DinB family protein, partial [Candidatus Thorarchaeota archaeon]